MRTSADGCAESPWRRRCSPWLWRPWPPRRRPAAPAPAPEGTTPGGASLVFSSPMRSAGATWYGPGLYGNDTACGADPAAGDDRRRPPHAALRDDGQVRLPRPLPGHAGDRPRPLHARQRLRPHQRRPPRARLRRGRAGPLRGRRRSPPTSASVSRISALMVNLPRNGQVSNERSMGMSRSSQAAVNAGLGWSRGRLALVIGLAGCLALLVALAANAGAATTSKTTVVLGNTATMPDPPAPSRPARRSAASPASRSAPARARCPSACARTARSSPGP